MEFRITNIDPILASDFQKDFIHRQKREITSEFKFKFRLLDGDRNIYFEGVSTRSNSFDPLDFLGTEYGCTDLQFFENGKFVSL